MVQFLNLFYFYFINKMKISNILINNVTKNLFMEHGIMFGGVINKVIEAN